MDALQAVMLEKITELRLMTEVGSYVIPRGSEVWRALRDAPMRRSDGKPDERTAIGKRLKAWQAKKVTAAKHAFWAGTDFELDGSFGA